MWHIYILKCFDGTYYTGITNDLDKRIATHNAQKGAKYTKTRTPVVLMYSEEVDSKSVALKREYAIKQFSRKEKENLINGSTSSED